VRCCQSSIFLAGRKFLDMVSNGLLRRRIVLRVIRLFRIITQYDEWTIVIGIRKCLLVWCCSWLHLFGCVQLTVTSLPEYFVFFPPAEPVFPVFRSGFIIVVVFTSLLLLSRQTWLSEEREKKVCSPCVMELSPSFRVIHLAYLSLL
jgi:hypothetical protein